MKVRLGNYIEEYSKKNKADEDIPVYSVTSTQGFCRDYFGKEVASKDKTTYKIVPQGCFAYNPSRINVGSVDWQRNEERVIVSPLYNVFSVSEELDQEYLYYYLKSDFALQRIRAVATGSVRDNLKLEMLKEFPILLPPKNDQKTIANNLDRVKRIIELRKSEIDKMNELIKARFVELFGDPDNNEKSWDIDKMEHLCEVGSSKRIYQNEQSMEGVPFLRISDLVNRIDTGSKKCDLYIPIEKFAELKEQGLVPRSGDILLTARGTLGRCYIVQSDDEFYFQDGMITWLSNYDRRITALYISYLFEMPGFRKQIDALQAGSTVAYMSISMTKKLNIMVPPIELQNQFADFVKQVDKSKVAVQKALEKTQLLFDSLMQQYFG
ncbi:restriction endonuclease subunit S [Blautia obeum]|uniref:restriction endonuclease subunit S n=1 Tax=Blautia obeum TaxID=40520 RepID=UPI0034A25DD6